MPPLPPPLPSTAPDASSDWQFETLTIDFRNDLDTSSRRNQIIEPTVTGRLASGDRLSFSTGFNTFSEPGLEEIFNLPLAIAWTREMGDFTTTLGAGVDIFDRLPTEFNWQASTEVPIGNSATLSLHLDRGPYKFNGTSLQNQITAWRYGPNVFWQIDADTSLFSQLRLGNFSDGNWEQQSFSRLERRLGEFSVALNVFNWQFRRDVEATSGYFSPPDFLVANGELAWRGQISSDVACRLAARLGPQRLTGDWSLTSGYEALCTAQFNQVEVDFGYAFSTVATSAAEEGYSNRTIRGQIRSRF